MRIHIAWHYWLRTHWMEAQGIPFWSQWEWKNPKMFHPYPSRCTLCGKWWRPDMEPFISLWGRIYVAHDEARMPYEKFEAISKPGTWRGGPITFVWRNPDIGEQPSGDLNDHIRHICYDHGGKEGRTVTDCQTGCEVWLPPELSPQRKQLRDTVQDVKYWMATTTRFAWMLLELLFNAVIHPVIFWKWATLHGYIKVT